MLDHMEAQALAGFRQTGQNVKYTLWADAQSSPDFPGVPIAVVDAVHRGKTVELPRCDGHHGWGGQGRGRGAGETAAQLAREPACEMGRAL
jgi:hypothetical protein